MTVLVMAIHMQTSNALPLTDTEANMITASDPETLFEGAEHVRSREPTEEELREMAKSIGEDVGLRGQNSLAALLEGSPHDALYKLAEDQATSSRAYNREDDPRVATNAATGGGDELVFGGSEGTTSEVASTGP